jgi:hypothetical protein
MVDPSPHPRTHHHPDIQGDPGGYLLALDQAARELTAAIDDATRSVDRHRAHALSLAHQTISRERNDVRDRLSLLPACLGNAS